MDWSRVSCGLACGWRLRGTGAFISYSHHGHRVARWCHSELSRQGVPRKLRTLVTANSSNISPIFLDEQSVAAASVISAELKAARRESRYLIVVCSPFAVASSYLCEEIRYFRSLGRSDRILCLVASGVPNASECMKWARVSEFEIEIDGKKVIEYRATTRIYFDIER